MNSFSPFFLYSLRQEAAIHSASLVYLHYVDPHAILPLLFIKNSRLDHRLKKFCVLYMCFPMCADERYCSPNVFYRLVPPLRTLKVTLSFPAKDTWALRISCTDKVIIMLVRAHRWFSLHIICRCYLFLNVSKYDLWFAKHEHNEI